MKHVTPLTTCERLEEILERYVSRITVSSMLATVLGQRGIERHDIDSENLVDIVGEVMIGLRLFCEEGKLAELMIDLAEFCDHETQPLRPAPSRRGVELAAGPPSRAHVTAR
jgi:hypothetical protein